LAIGHERIFRVPTFQPARGESEDCFVASASNAGWGGKGKKYGWRYRFRTSSYSGQGIRSTENTFPAKNWSQPPPWAAKIISALEHAASAKSFLVAAERSEAALGLRFVYPLPDGRIVLSIDIGESSSIEAELDRGDEVVIAGANFHRDCTMYPADAEVESHLQGVPDDWTVFQRLLHEILAIEW
jgi:hypothetical protein